MNYKKWLLFLFVVLSVFIAWKIDLFTYLNFDFIKSHIAEANSYYHQSPLVVSVAYFLFYVFITAISFPGGATLLTLLGGAVLGFGSTLVLVSFASTIGATLSFLISRFLLRDFFQTKFKEQMKIVYDEVEKNGMYYLLTLRLAPVFPFFLINILMGLTNIRVVPFFFISQLGMLPATAVYVWAGKGLGQMNSPKDILSPQMLIIFILLGFFPLLAKFLVNKIRLIKMYNRFNKPKKFDYNTIVIGGGSAGLVSAYMSASFKARVALVEKDNMGGDCLNSGCIPSKAFIEASKLPLDFENVMKRVKQSIEQIAPHDSIERYTSLGVDCLKAEGRILGPYEVAVNDRVFTTKNIIVASGARPKVPTIPGSEKIHILTSDTVWNLSTLPTTLIILGAGPVGCELAQAFLRLGAKVYLIEKAKELLPQEDSDVSSVLLKKFQQDGMEVHLSTSALEITVEDEKKFLLVQSGNNKSKLMFDEIVAATGRDPNTKGFGLETLGIELNANGTIKTNSNMQTNFPNIYACGDVAGPFQLTHMASYQAWFAAVNSLFGAFKKFSVNYRSVPWCTFTEPAIATVGANEKKLQRDGIEYDITIFPFHELDRAIVDCKTEGFIKVLTAKKSDKILGATIVGAHADLLIHEFVMAMKFNKGMRDLLGVIHLYPSLMEGNKYAAGLWQKNHAPQRILNFLEKFFRWKRQ